LICGAAHTGHNAAIERRRPRPQIGSDRSFILGPGNAVSVLLIFGVAGIVIAWIAAQPYLLAARRRRRSRQPFPEAWRSILKHHVPYFATLPADLQLQLKQRMQVFLAEKIFIGCDGLVVTDVMRVTIAAYACLLILNRPTEYYPHLREILVYPGAFIADRTHTDAAGVVHPRREALAGESWVRGRVVLSWEDVVDGIGVGDDGFNVVIHEFAHQLDQEKGAATGAPLLERSAHYKTWSQVWAAEFERLLELERTGQWSLFRDYGATNPAEFFAVVSEVFFEQPQQMAELHPELYREISGFYRLDPLSW
jgi:MtfA peptidase